MADHPSPCEKHREHGDCELELISEQYNVGKSRFSKAPVRNRDDSSVVIAVDHSACILCDRCIRGCNDIKNNQVLGRMGKGFAARIAFDNDLPMGNSSCVSCGECMVSCPTGALTNRTVVNRIVDVLPKKTVVTDGPVSPDELIRLPLFEGISHAFLRFNENAVVRRTFKKGETICREGDFGSTAFYIEQGKVDIFIKATFNHAKTRGGHNGSGLFGLVQRITTVFETRKQDHRQGESTTQYIHIDAPVALKYDNPVDTLEAGDIFGEMTCMNSYPRSATVTAAEDVTVLEMDRNVLYILQRSKKSKALLDDRYRRRAIDNHLRSVPIFATVARDAAEYLRLCDLLRERVTLERKNNGELIFSQNDPADAFYLIRTGFVKVAQSHMGSEHVLNYLGPGGFFGEIGLLADLPEVQAHGVNAARRTATCSALDHVRPGQALGRGVPGGARPVPRCPPPGDRPGRPASQRHRRDAQPDREPSARRVPQPGPDERPEPAGARPGEMHPLRRMHQGLRRYSRRRHPPDPRRAPVRQVPGRQLVPVVP